MNLPSIKTFLAIAETGQLNRAAEHLHVTQSTVTARLNKLEDDIGQRLFHRRKSGAEMTSAGFRFERYAQLMVDIWKQAQQEIALPSQVESTFNLGCHADLWTDLGESLVDGIRELKTNVAISIWTGEQNDLNRWLDNGLIDASICYSPSLKNSRTQYQLHTDRLLLVSTEVRELIRWDPKYVYIDAGEEFRKSHAAAYQDGDTPTMTIGSAVWAKSFLLKHGGSGYLPRRLIESELESSSLHLVPDAPEFTRDIYMVVNNDAAINWPWLEQVIDEVF